MKKILKIEIFAEKDSCGFCLYKDHTGYNNWCKLFGRKLTELIIDTKRLPVCIAAEKENENAE